MSTLTAPAGDYLEITKKYNTQHNNDNNNLIKQHNNNKLKIFIYFDKQLI